MYTVYFNMIVFMHLVYSLYLIKNKKIIKKIPTLDNKNEYTYYIIIYVI